MFFVSLWFVPLARQQNYISRIHFTHQTQESLNTNMELLPPDSPLFVNHKDRKLGF
ncbi:hypothetical protein C789_4958 [Microcystis aeruginosa FACHB-905 = DIANCHI905]|nr:hypothetical protein C789_4958 [Microcystis aeruginosa FACHB-905 = DIANCHI905]